MPGTACAVITDWKQCYRFFKLNLRGKITRWYGAVDVYNGKPSVDDAVQYYEEGLFNCGGKKPSCSQHGNWIDPDGSGRTFCVGKRKNGKFLRVYEKGKQLGDPDNVWVRWELELHSRRGNIPWEVILEPGKYLAASYPCMVWVNDIQERIKANTKTAQISYESSIFHLRHSYGKLINVMLEVEGSPEKVIELLIREGVPARLDCGENSLSELISKKNDAGNIK